MTESLAFRIARQKVDSYTNEPDAVIRQHYEAMDCFDCEDYLQLAIDAFRWVQRAEERWNHLVRSGEAAFDPEIENTLDFLYEAWLEPCNSAEERIKKQTDRDYHPANLDEFRKCCQEVLDIVEQRGLRKKALESRIALSAEEDW